MRPAGHRRRQHSGLCRAGARARLDAINAFFAGEDNGLAPTVNGEPNIEDATRLLRERDRLRKELGA